MSGHAPLTMVGAVTVAVGTIDGALLTVGHTVAAARKVVRRLQQAVVASSHPAQAPRRGRRHAGRTRLTSATTTIAMRKVASPWPQSPKR